MMALARMLAGLLAAVLALAGPAPAAPPVPAVRPVLASADMRGGLDLSGAWHWSIDPYRDGLAGFHGGAVGEASQRWIDRDPEEIARERPSAHFEQDMRLSPTVVLPSSWITHDATMRHYHGLVWYQRTFQAAPRAGERAFLRFGAVDYTAHVYLNGQLVGRHEGGFTPFAFEVTRLLRPGENRLTVGVDSARTDATVPPPVTDWETYGGITRAVTLVTVPATFVDDAWIRLGRDGRIAATVRLDGAGMASRPVVVRVPALGLAIEGRTGADGGWSGSVPAPRSLRRWSPEEPALYDVTVEAAGDVLRDRIGFRTIEVRGADILLNGRPVFLRGISLHEEEFGAEPTRAITPAAARALLSEAKNGLHANFVRLAHYPHGEIMTRTADELGLIVWSEVPVYWRVDWNGAATLATARAMLAENILRDRNRASIALWSVANETPVSDGRNAFLRTLIADVRALDDTRLVTAALLTERGEENGHPVMRIEDPLVADLDVMAVNTYNGWYTPDPLPSLPAIGWSSPVAKPLILSEFGADALAGFHDGGRRKFSEEFQAEYYRQTLAMAARIPLLRGMSPWILKDFRSPRRQHPVYQQGWNRKGLVSETGRRKAAFEVLAAEYRQRAAGAASAGSPEAPR
jgi:beta-glucuronidase